MCFQAFVRSTNGEKNNFLKISSEIPYTLDFLFKIIIKQIIQLVHGKFD